MQWVPWLGLFAAAFARTGGRSLTRACVCECAWVRMSYVCVRVCACVRGGRVRACVSRICTAHRVARRHGKEGEDARVGVCVQVITRITLIRCREGREPHASPTQPGTRGGRRGPG